MDNSQRVILNTAVNYISLLVKMAVGVFTARFVLQALGETDYGIYFAVAGVVGVLDMLNANMTNTSMRYLAHSLGSGDPEVVRKTFNSTLYIHYLIGVITIVIMEVGGLLMLEYVLKIPTEKMIDAHIIFQFMVITMFITIIAVPYDAVMNAHERIWMLSVFNIINSLMALALALYLLVSKGNRLVQYGFFVMLIQVVLRICKTIYSKRHFEECRNISLRKRDKQYVKSILSFTGWNLFGSISASFSSHFRGIVINMFFGVRLNAAEGISRTVSNYVNMVATSMTKAINPQLVKSEGGGNRERMLRITEIAAKYSSFLFAIIGVPFAIEAPYIIKLWLKDVPEFTVIFCQLTMINMLISKFSFQIVSAIQAVGKIRDFQLVETFLSFLPLLFAYILFKKGYPPVAIYYLSIIINVPIIIFRFYFGKKIAGLNIMQFIKNGILSSLIPLSLAMIPILVFIYFVPESIIRVIGTFGIYATIFTSLFWVMGLNKDERIRWRGIAAPLLKKIHITK